MAVVVGVMVHLLLVLLLVLVLMHHDPVSLPQLKRLMALQVSPLHALRCCLGHPPSWCSRACMQGPPPHSQPYA